MRSVKRVLLVAADGFLPGPTHSGNAVVRWGLIAGLRASGVDVGFYLTGDTDYRKTKLDETDIVRILGPDRLWLDLPGLNANFETGNELSDALTACDPDVVLVYGLKGMRAMCGVEYGGPVGIMSVDLEFLPPLYRIMHFLRAGDMRRKLTTMSGLPRKVHGALHVRREILAAYPRADFIVNHAAHHAEWHRRRHKRKTFYTPNPVEAIYPTRPARIATAPPRFMLLGGLGGIATLAGLEWFANRVYPLIEADLAAGCFEVHLVGRSELPTPLHQRMKRVVMRGYVDDLDEEMRRTTAVLVPTPIRLGFRTRILDAFRHGVTVVSHDANAAGMPELADERNGLVTADPRSFASAIRALAADPEMSERLGQAAFDEFSGGLDAVTVAKNLVAFIETEVLNS